MIKGNRRRRRPRRPALYGQESPAHRAVREQLFDLLLTIVREDELSQCAVQHMFKLTQPRASNLAHRHLEKFNSEALIDMLARVGVRLEIAVASRERYRRWELPCAPRTVYPTPTVSRMPVPMPRSPWRYSN